MSEQYEFSFRDNRCAFCQSAYQSQCQNAVVFPRVHGTSQRGLRQKPIMYLCREHMLKFLYGVNLHETFTPDNFPAYYFSEQENREKVFGSDGSYISFCRLLFGIRTRIMPTLEVAFENALSKQDFLRYATIYGTYDWNDREFYEWADFTGNGQTYHHSSESVKFFSYFAWRVCRCGRSTPPPTPIDKNVYIRVYMAEQKSGNWRNKYLLCTDYIYLIVDTNPQRMEESYRRLRNYDSRLFTAELIEGFTLPVCDETFKKLTEFLRMFQDHQTSGVSSMMDVEDRNLWGAYLQNYRSNYGMQYWSETDKMFDYAT